MRLGAWSSGERVLRCNAAAARTPERLFAKRGDRSDGVADCRMDCIFLGVMDSVRIAKTVLVVDDDEDVRDTIADALAPLGYDVLFAHDGQDALDVLEQVDDLDMLCVVLADVHMPRLDGPGLARAIRRDPKLSHVRILVVSSSPEYGAGVADETLSKPFEVAALQEAVERLCTKSEVQRSLPG